MFYTHAKDAVTGMLKYNTNSIVAVKVCVWHLQPTTQMVPFVVLNVKSTVNCDKGCHMSSHVDLQVQKRDECT